MKVGEVMDYKTVVRKITITIIEAIKVYCSIAMIESIFQNTNRLLSFNSPTTIGSSIITFCFCLYVGYTGYAK